jgi:type II secretory pathway component PulM
MKGADELRAAWARLSPREQVGVAVGGGVLVLFLVYLLVLDPLISGLHSASSRIRRERALYAWIARHESRLEQAAGSPSLPLTPSFRGAIQNRLVRLFGHDHPFKIHATGRNRLTVVMKHVPYEPLVADFLPFLVRHGIELRRIDIDHGTPGSDSVEVTVELADHAQTH